MSSSQYNKELSILAFYVFICILLINLIANIKSAGY